MSKLAEKVPKFLVDFSWKYDPDADNIKVEFFHDSLERHFWFTVPRMELVNFIVVNELNVFGPLSWEDTDNVICPADIIVKENLITNPEMYTFLRDWLS